MNRAKPAKRAKNTIYMGKSKGGEVEMSYQSPIEVFQTQIQNQIEGEIYKAVIKVGVNVDKDELLKALRYDRDQYQKGYTDRDSKIVRCKNCKYCVKEPNGELYCDILAEGGYEPLGSKKVNEEWFCADGECKEGR